VAPKTLMFQGGAATALTRPASTASPMARNAMATPVARNNMAESQIGSGGSVPGQGAAPMLMHEPGGELLNKLVHPVFQVIEQMDRVLPEESWFSNLVTPNAPIQFDITSYQVPEGKTLWIYEYEFQIYRFSGVDAGDFIAAEHGRFTNVMGFDVRVGERRPNHIRYGLDPQPIQVSRIQYRPTVQDLNMSDPATFNQQASKSFGNVAGTSMALLPVRREMQGPSNAPFTMFANENENINLSCVIFRQVQTPLAAIEARFAGYLMNDQVSTALLNRIRPL
jgi:hypothetical protein